MFQNWLGSLRGVTVQSATARLFVVVACGPVIDELLSVTWQSVMHGARGYGDDVPMYWLQMLAFCEDPCYGRGVTVESMDHLSSLEDAALLLRRA